MKTQAELNADTLFAFQMALNGHKQFEWYDLDEKKWFRTGIVTNVRPQRIYHDLPSPEWTRHDGEGWKGDPDAKFEAVMFCDGRINSGTTDLDYWTFGKSNFSGNPDGRIYAYKLKPAISIPEGFTKWDGGLKPLLAKLLLDEVYFREGCGLFWKARTRPDMRQNVAVLDTELLHLVSLVEARLTVDESCTYFDLLRDIEPDNDAAGAFAYHATWQQRTTALAVVKGVSL